MDNCKQAQRRSFFRKAGIATLIGGLAAGIGLKAFAHGRYRGPIDPAELEERLDRMLKHFYVEIDATEEQKQRLAPIVKDTVKDLMPMRDRLRAARGQAIELLSGDSIDPAAIESLRAEHLRLADDASRRLARGIAEAAEVLTPAQRKELAAHIARRHRRWGHG
jgi:Spy/CpxP family protein refolding chaperone